MRRMMVLLAAVAAVTLACSQPDVTLSAGNGGAGPAAEPPDEAPYIKGTIQSIAKAEPVTTDCVSESDPDGDGAVSSNDPPVCNPEPSTHGSMHLKGGGNEMVASVEKDVPLVRRTSDGEVKPIEFDDLSEGDVVSVWVDGPVMESYPVQGGASFVLLEE